MASYSITVKRPKGSEDTGTLSYSGKVSVVTKCWWDAEKKIPAGTYGGCSATTMSTKKNSKGQPREGVYIPGVPGFRGIFVHMGSGPGWSDGCIVIRESEMLKIWNDIDPKDGRNVTVMVSDTA